jgi:hypothetical protein
MKCCDDPLRPPARADVQPRAFEFSRAWASVRPSLLASGGPPRTIPRAVLAAGHAFMQNLRRGHYELGTDVPPLQRLISAFTELALAI